MNKVRFGVDQFNASHKNYRFGLITNDAATTASGVKSRVFLLAAGYNIVKLFSPEHGLSAGAADGAWVANQTDTLTNLPVVSLYGDKLKPTAEDLKDLDTILFDIPDVGCRYYTYLWTMTYVMEACAIHGKKFIVLDRPNPLSGDLSKAEGPKLDSDCSSFLGRWNIPLRHSCTLGELATFFAAKYIPNLDLEVIKVENWRRKDFPDHDTWNFMPTSPAIKDAETALLYPGLGLLEGINVNEGRGTSNEFKMFGAPWIDATSLKTELDILNLDTIVFTTHKYTPSWGLYQDQVCQGLLLEVTKKELFKPVALGVEIIKILINKYPEDCKERHYKTNANPHGEGHLDKLLGVNNSFHCLQGDGSIQTQLREEEWQDMISPYLLYS